MGLMLEEKNCRKNEIFRKNDPNETTCRELSCRMMLVRRSVLTRREVKCDKTERARERERRQKRERERESMRARGGNRKGAKEG